jgi:hypothetical protein
MLAGAGGSVARSSTGSGSSSELTPLRSASSGEANPYRRSEILPLRRQSPVSLTNLFISKKSIAFLRKYENIVHVIDFMSITGALVVPASV